MRKIPIKPRLKTQAARKQQAKRRQSTGGYSTLTYACRIVVGLGLIGIGAGLVILFQPHTQQRDPLTSLSHTSNAPDASEVLRLVNTAREAINVPKVTTDDQLNAVAEERLKDMVDKQYYSHQNLKGQYYYDLFAGRNFKTDYSCENLDIDTTLVAKKYIDDWLNSNEGHRDCMLSTKVSKIGVATGPFGKDTDEADKTYLVVTIYATPPMALKDQ